MSDLHVLKFGGSSLSSPEQIKSVARKVSELRAGGKQVVVVVSAMGKTTNELLLLAHKISSMPHPRELDMLLTTGERVSMSLMCMALHDNGCPAISFTGSQAGIMTDGSHFNAKIVNVNSPRVKQALADNKVVVLAGFQGVDPHTKEITTLGRGGSDTTAVAMAAHLGAKSCQILKDVPGVFTADPHIVPQAKVISHLPLRSLLNMTFWGAKVLHHRSVELALRENVTLEVGLSESFAIGTTVMRDDGGNMPFEQHEILSVNSQAIVEHAFIKCDSADQGLKIFQSALQERQLPWPHLLASVFESGTLRMMFSGDTDSLQAIRQQLETSKKENIKMRADALSSVTLTCYGAVASDLAVKVMDVFGKNGIHVEKFIQGPISLTAFVPTTERVRAVEAAHSLLKKEGC